MIKSVTVYLGSSSGSCPSFCEAAYTLGRELALKGVSIIYGGACVGTMKALADGVASAGGEITGVFPKGFKGKIENSSRGIEVRHNGLSSMIEVEDMSQRKETMEKLGELCVALPGSFGTFDELFQYLVKRQLKIFSKPIFILNVNGYYNPLIQMFENMVDNGFMSKEDLSIVTFCDSVEDLISKICALTQN